MVHLYEFDVCHWFGLIKIKNEFGGRVLPRYNESALLGAVLVAGATIVLFSVILGAKLPYAVTPVTLFYVLSRDGAGFVTSKMTLASCPLILAG